MAVGPFERCGGYKGRQEQNVKALGKALHQPVYLPDPAAADDAAQLIERFGVYAASEAEARADRSRDLGNVIHFCRWRQIARMIEMYAIADRADGTLH